MTERIEPVQNKRGDLAQEVSATPGDKRGAPLLAIGVLTLGVGVGIWALIRKFRAEPLDTEVSYDPDDFRRSGQY